MNVGGCVACRGCGPAHRLVLLAMLGLLLSSGCAGGPKVILPELQTTIDRKLVEYPADTEFRPYIEGLTAETPAKPTWCERAEIRPFWSRRRHKKLTPSRQRTQRALRAMGRFSCRADADLKQF